MNLSKSDKIIIDAVEFGYYADDKGTIYSPRGRVVKGHVVKTGHVSVSFYFGPGSPKIGSVLAHRFVYYFFHREEMFKHRLVRHLDNDPTNNAIENLKAGTHKENRADIPREVLSAIAKRNAPKFVELNRKLSQEEILEMRDVRSKFPFSYKTLGALYGVTAMTACRCCNYQSWKEAA